jgi:hypothetical protein
LLRLKTGSAVMGSAVSVVIRETQLLAALLVALRLEVWLVA